MIGWQPIETAPRDGTWFVAARFPAEDHFCVEVGKYDPMTWADYEHVEGDLYRRIDRQIYDWRGFNNFHRMTHWMPLPEPPQ